MNYSNKLLQGNSLKNTTSSLKSQNNLPSGSIGRAAPSLPPRPDGLYRPSTSFNIPYSGYGGHSYGSYGGNYGGMSSYMGSYGMPYSSSPYSSYNSYGYNNLGMYGLPTTGGYSAFNDDAERRFVHYAEESARRTFSNVESIVRAFSSIAMMLDNTFFAMTSSFRAVLSVAENFGRLRSTFGQIWYSVSIFRVFTWLYRKFMQFLGYEVRNSSSIAWSQAVRNVGGQTPGSGSSWPIITFLGVLISTPYVINKFLPKYEDKSDRTTWKSPGISAKAAFDFVATNPSEMSLVTNDDITLAPTYIQESMKLKNSGWVFALCNGKNGLIPLNYVVLNKSQRSPESPLKNERINPQNWCDDLNRISTGVSGEKEFNTKNESKTHTKRVSFGENQVFENIDLDDVIKKAEIEAKQYMNKSHTSIQSEENNTDR